MTIPAHPHLVIPARFRGPATSGNGGWVSGALAAALLTALGRAGDHPVQVRLSAPPPLDVELDLEPFTIDDPEPQTAPRTGLRLVRRDGDAVQAIAQAVEADARATADLVDVPPVSQAAAAAAALRYHGRENHPFPTCVGCGTGRSEGDGLRLAPGALDPADDTVAAPWVPHPAFDAGDGQVDVPLTWTALDCSGGWAVDLTGRPMVLGTMTAQVLRLPRIGEHCVVRGEAVAVEARKARTRTTLYGEDGAVLGRAAQVWIVVDPSIFQS